MRPPSLLHLVFLVSTAAAINPSLRFLCLSPLIDSPIQEDDFNKRIDGDACEQTFPYPGTEKQHEMFCRNRLPFDFEVLPSPKNHVKCRWTTASACKDEGYQQIFDKCYHIGGCSKHDMKIAKPTSEDEVRWISILYGDLYQALHIEKSKAFADKVKPGFFEDGILWKTNTGTRPTKDAMILTRMAAFGLYPGDFVETTDQSMNTLCSARADAIGSLKSIVTEVVATQTQLPSLGTVNSQMNIFGTAYSQTTVKISNGYAFPTRNVYQGRLKTKGEVDVMYFHGVCGNICQGCYAATYESFETNKAEIPDGRYWVPASRPSSDKTFNDDNSCGKSVDQRKKKSFKALINPNNDKKHVPKMNQWSKEPTWGCSDADRLGVQIVKDGNSLTYVDVPLFDYRPIMCISGAPVPATMETGECFPNSHMVNGACKCKDGYDDAMGIPNIAMKLRPRGYNINGTICVKAEACQYTTTEESPYSAVIFMLDGSATVGGDGYQQLRDFVKNIGKRLPTIVPITFWQYAEGSHHPKQRNGQGCRLHPSCIYELGANWKIADYDFYANELNYGSIGWKPHSYWHLSTMLQDKKHIQGTKLVIWVSREAVDSDNYGLPAKVQEGFHLIGIAVGDMGRQFTYLIPDASNRIRIEDVAGLNNKNILTKITTEFCPEYPEHVIQAAIGE